MSTSSYFEHFASKGRDKTDVSLDIIEFTPDTGIEVEEKHFDSIGEFHRFVMEQTGETAK